MPRMQKIWSASSGMGASPKWVYFLASVQQHHHRLTKPVCSWLRIPSMELGIAGFLWLLALLPLADANTGFSWHFPPRASVVAPSQQTLDEDAKVGEQRTTSNHYLAGQLERRYRLRRDVTMLPLDGRDRSPHGKTRSCGWRAGRALALSSWCKTMERLER